MLSQFPFGHFMVMYQYSMNPLSEHLPMRCKIIRIVAEPGVRLFIFSYISTILEGL